MFHDSFRAISLKFHLTLMKLAMSSPFSADDSCDTAFVAFAPTVLSGLARRRRFRQPSLLHLGFDCFVARHDTGLLDGFQRFLHKIRITRAPSSESLQKPLDYAGLQDADAFGR